MKEITVDHSWVETTMVDGAPVERERTVSLVVAGPADMSMGFRRSLLIETQKSEWDDEKEDLVNSGWSAVDLVAREMLRTQLFPNMIACVVRQEGFDHWPIGFDQFMALPEELGWKWEAAVGELNGHWAPKPDPETVKELEELRKKVMSGTLESSNG